MTTFRSDSWFVYGYRVNTSPHCADLDHIFKAENVPTIELVSAVAKAAAHGCDELILSKGGPRVVLPAARHALDEGNEDETTDS
jgi:hypothetical protein